MAEDSEREDDSAAVVVEPRLYDMNQVATLLSTSVAQVRALVRSGELPAIRLGGRGQWRVDRTRLDTWLEEQHEATAEWIRNHPFP